MGDVGEAADMLSSAGDLEAKENPAGACELLKGAAQMFIKSGKSAEVGLFKGRQLRSTVN